MNKIFGLFFIIIFLSQVCCAQKFDIKLVSRKTELNFFQTNLRGINGKNITYMVENDLQTISAYHNGKIFWRTNIISVCGKPSVGKAEIRHFNLIDDTLFITYGKHSFAVVDIKNGKTNFWGSD